MPYFWIIELVFLTQEKLKPPEMGGIKFCAPRSRRSSNFFY
jgi:hypothetical protein